MKLCIRRVPARPAHVHEPNHVVAAQLAMYNPFPRQPVRNMPKDQGAAPGAQLLRVCLPAVLPPSLHVDFILLSTTGSPPPRCSSEIWTH